LRAGHVSNSSRRSSTRPGRGFRRRGPSPWIPRSFPIRRPARSAFGK